MSKAESNDKQNNAGQTSARRYRAILARCAAPQLFSAYAQLCFRSLSFFYLGEARFNPSIQGSRLVDYLFTGLASNRLT